MSPDSTSTRSVKALEDDDLLVLRQALDRLRRYRRIIVLSILAVGLVASSVALIMYRRTPVEEIGSVRFHLLFDEAPRNQYPNGAPFSPADITADRLLLRVYQRTDVHRYTDYETFKSSVFVTDGRATSSGGLSLNMRRAGSIAAMPPELMGTALTETIAIWAHHTNQTKTRHRVALRSSASIELEALERDDFLIAAEILQSYVRRADQAVAELGMIPGAHGMRAGPSQRTLADIRAQLEDVDRLELEPILDRVRTDGISKSPGALRTYANGRLHRLRAERERVEHRIKTLQQSLVAYDTGRWVDAAPADGIRALPSDTDTSPRMNRTFLDRLLRRSNTSATEAYRRGLLDRFISANERGATLRLQESYYHELLKTLDADAPGPPASPDRAAGANAHIRRAFDRVVDAFVHISAISEKLSDANLDPSVLYAVTSPFSITTMRAVSPRTAALFVVLSLVIAVILIPAACLMHAAARPQPIGTSLSVTEQA